MRLLRTEANERQGSRITLAGVTLSPPNKGKCINENGAVNVENLTLMAAVSSSLQMNETRRFLSCLVSSLRKHTNSLEREKKKNT